MLVPEWIEQGKAALEIEACVRRVVDGATADEPAEKENKVCAAKRPVGGGR